jgi:hypothetical protein
MNRIELEGTDLTLPDLAKLLKKGTVILMRKGKPLAAVKALAGNDWESVSLSNNPRFLALIEESRRSYREKGGISLEAIRKELALAKPKRNATLKQK